MRYITNNDKDEYAQATAIENAGGDCPHCGSPSGHKVYCSLINKEAQQQLQQLEDLYLIKKTQADGVCVLG